MENEPGEGTRGNGYLVLEIGSKTHPLNRNQNQIVK